MRNKSCTVIVLQLLKTSSYAVKLTGFSQHLKIFYYSIPFLFESYPVISKIYLSNVFPVSKVVFLLNYHKLLIYFQKFTICIRSEDLGFTLYGVHSDCCLFRVCMSLDHLECFSPFYMSVPARSKFFSCNNLKI